MIHWKELTRAYFFSFKSIFCQLIGACELANKARTSCVRERQTTFGLRGVYSFLTIYLIDALSLFALRLKIVSIPVKERCKWTLLVSSFFEMWKRQRCRLIGAAFWRQFCAVKGFSVSLVLSSLQSPHFPYIFLFSRTVRRVRRSLPSFVHIFPHTTFLNPHAFTFNPFSSRYRRNCSSWR